MIYNETCNGGVQVAGTAFPPVVQALAATSGGMDRFVGGELFAYAGAATLGLDRFVSGELFRGAFGSASTSNTYNESWTAGVQAGGQASAGLALTANRSGGVQVGASPVTGPYAFDSFLDVPGTTLPNHRSEAGGTWFNHPAYPSAVVAMAQWDTAALISGPVGLVYHSFQPPSADYSVTTSLIDVFTSTGTDDGTRAGLCLRMSTTEETLLSRCRFRR